MPTCSVCGAPVGTSTGAGEYDGVLSVGTALHGGDYTVGKVLGRGGFGITYLGADCRLRRATALKEYFPAGAGRRGTTLVAPPTVAASEFEADRRRFLEEARVLARFPHQSIVAVYDVFEENNTAYMVMEYLAGDTLASRVERRGPVPEPELVALARPIAEALDLIHTAGVLHRDIKPENIMMVRGPTGVRPVLIDFGAAREFVRNRTMKHSVVLTPGYAPLEQYAEQSRRGPYTDVYSLAATLYHAATGVQPPTATDRALGAVLRPPRALSPALSAAFSDAIVHGLEMAVNHRPRTAHEFFQEMVGAKVASTPSGRSSRTSGRRRDGAGSGSHPAPPKSTPHLDRFEELARRLEANTPIRTDAIVCPVCRATALIDPARATGAIRCPVCRDTGLGTLVSPEGYGRCPSCRSRLLEARAPDGPMYCPCCRAGRLREYVKRRRFLILADTWASCDRCAAEFDVGSGSMTLMELPNGPGSLPAVRVGTSLPLPEWDAMSGRTRRGYDCPLCHAEFDEYDDQTVEWKSTEGRFDHVPLQHRGRRRSRLAWAKIAHGVHPAFGTRACPGCQAQFDEHTRGELTFLGSPSDPYGTMARYDGKTLPIEQWRRVAAGVRDPSRAGLICPSCTAEFVEVRPDAYQLQAFDRARDHYGVGARYGKQSLRREGLQRLAAGRPVGDEERRLRNEAQDALWAAYLAGEVSNSAAERSYPVRRSGDERVILSFPANQLVVRARYFIPDHGHLWITTDRLLYRGTRSNASIPFANASQCTLSGTFGEHAFEVWRVDRVKPLYFALPGGPVPAGVEGYDLKLELDLGRMAQLIDHYIRSI